MGLTDPGGPGNEARACCKRNLLLKFEVFTFARDYFVHKVDTTWHHILETVEIINSEHSAASPVSRISTDAMKACKLYIAQRVLLFIVLFCWRFLQVEHKGQSVRYFPQQQFPHLGDHSHVGSWYTIICSLWHFKRRVIFWAHLSSLSKIFAETSGLVDCVVFCAEKHSVSFPGKRYVLYFEIFYC